MFRQQGRCIETEPTGRAGCEILNEYIGRFDQAREDFRGARVLHVERKFRETRLYQVAPISTNLILSYIGEHVLGMPRSF